MTSTKKIKIALVLDTLEVPAWFHASIQKISRESAAEISAIILLCEQPVIKKPAANRWRTLIYAFLSQIDEKLFVRKSNAFHKVDLRTSLEDVPIINVSRTQDENGFNIQPDELILLKNLNLDLLIQMAPEPVPPMFLAVARLGIWCINHSDDRLVRGEPEGFWEAVERQPVTGITLLMMNEQHPAGKAIFRSQIMTFKYSAARNRQVLYWSSASILPDQLGLLSRLGETEYFARAAIYASGLEIYHHPLRRIPNNLEALRCYSKLYLTQLEEIFHRIFSIDQWFLLYANDPSHSNSIHQFKKLIPPVDRFWADPHLIIKDGRVYIFVEELFFTHRKGHIAVIEMGSSGNWLPSRKVLEEKYHLSYPFVFEHEQKIYMIPETGENNSVDLYECLEFPDRWQFKMRLLNGVDAKDTTLIHQSGKWWLFTGITEHQGASPEVNTHIFYADELLTNQWTPHRLNPVVSDVTNARPAGRLFWKDGKLYRPTQNCSHIYGYGININEVTILSEDDFVEHHVAEIKPLWHDRIMATHTYTHYDGWIFIDAFTRRLKILGNRSYPI